MTKQDHKYTTKIADSPPTTTIGDTTIVGVLHGQSASIAHLSETITHTDPDIIAVETDKDGLFTHHPDHLEPTWPPEDEVELASFIATHEDMYVAGIDTADPDRVHTDLKSVDEEIFQQLGILSPTETLTPECYYRLTKQSIREWRRHTKRKAKHAFEQTLILREREMAKNIHTLHKHESTENTVVAVGMQHITGVSDELKTLLRSNTQPKTIPPVMNPYLQ